MKTYNCPPLNELANESANQPIHGLYLLKLWAAFLVVQIHTQSAIAPIISPFLRTAVPIFFMITGYFLIGSDFVIDKRRVNHSIIKTFKFTICWQLIYLLFFFATQIFTNDFDLAALIPHNSDDFIKLFVHGTFYAIPFWYLNALIFALIVIRFLLCLNSKLIFMLGAVGLVYSLFAVNYFHLDFYNRLETLNSTAVLGIAVPSISIGMCIRLFAAKIKYKRTVIIIMTATILLAYLEYAIYPPSQSYGVTLMTFPIAAALVLLCVTFKMPKDLLPLANLGKKYSTHIFTTHMMFLAFPSLLVLIPSQIQTFAIFIMAMMSAMLIDKGKRLLQTKAYTKSLPFRAN